MAFFESRKRLSALVAVALGVSASIAQAQSEDVVLDVRHFYQDDACWCGVAAAEMLEQYVRSSEWSFYPERQANLARLGSDRGVSVGSYTGDGDSPCGSDRGVSAVEMYNMLRWRLPSAYYRQVTNRPDRGAADVSSTLHGAFVRALRESNEIREPILVNGHTRYRGGRKAYLQHWYVVVGYRDVDGLPWTVDPDQDGYYIHDPAHRSPAAGRLVTLPPAHFVSHRNFVGLLTLNAGVVSWMQRTR